MIRLLSSCLVALLVGLLMTRVAKTLALRFGVVDKPDARRVHKGVVPRMGGLGIYCGFMAGALVYTLSHPNLTLAGEPLGLLLAATIVFITGLVDDVRSIRPTTKLAGQLLAALVFVGFGGYIKFLSNPFGGDIIYVDYWGIPVTLLWLVGISNAVNLIDGLDGLAGGVVLSRLARWRWLRFLTATIWRRLCCLCWRRPRWVFCVTILARPAFLWAIAVH